jgi:hypothetical protein
MGCWAADANRKSAGRMGQDLKLHGVAELGEQEIAFDLRGIAVPERMSVRCQNPLRHGSCASLTNVCLP